MQKIKVDASFAEDWIRMFAHLANLFFEQCEIITKEDSEAMDVHFTIEHQPNGEIVGQAKLITKESEFVATFSEQAVEGEQRLINRQLKRIHSHVFLEVLEQATEMTQSWGILTGIRPMKLYHKYRQEGLSSEQAIENLMTNYRVSREKSELLAHIASIQKKAVPDLYDLKKEVSIYLSLIHI